MLGISLSPHHIYALYYCVILIYAFIGPLNFPMQLCMECIMAPSYWQHPTLYEALGSNLFPWRRSFSMNDVIDQIWRIAGSRSRIRRNFKFLRPVANSLRMPGTARDNTRKLYAFQRPIRRRWGSLSPSPSRRPDVGNCHRRFPP